MSAFYKLYCNKAYPPLDPTGSFAGQTIIVTGSNVGLGFEAAAKFAKLGAARVILAVRNEKKGAKAAAEIEERQARDEHEGADHHARCRIDVWLLDMNSYDSVKAFAARAEAELERLDVAVLNAGVWMAGFEKSPHGWEETLQVNVLSTALLALLLMPKLKATKKTTGATPTLEIVSSGLHEVVKLSEEERAMAGSGLMQYFNEPERFSGMRQYSVSKLMVMCVLGELARLAARQDSSTAGKGGGPPEVYCTSVCPGICRSELGRGVQGVIVGMAKSLFSLVQRSAEEGARILVSGTQTHESGHGRFWKDDSVKPVTPLLEGEDGRKFQEGIWKEVLEALNEMPEVQNSLSMINDS